MNLKKKNQLLDMFIDNKTLTFGELRSSGFTKNELKSLIRYNDIELLEDGTYSLCGSPGMLFYANGLYKKGNHERAKAAWERCLEVKPNNYPASTMLFLDSLLEEDFDKAFEYFEIMERTVNKEFGAEHNLWLLLLSQVTNVPDKYKKRISELRIEDILISENDSKYTDKERLNRVRKSIYGCDFDKALYLSHKVSETNSKKSYSVITKTLLDLASVAYKEKNELYVKLINEERYEELVQVLDNIQARGVFTYPEQCLFFLASDMASMKKNVINNMQRRRVLIIY